MAPNTLWYSKHCFFEDLGEKYVLVSQRYAIIFLICPDYHTRMQEFAQIYKLLLHTHKKTVSLSRHLLHKLQIILWAGYFMFFKCFICTIRSLLDVVLQVGLQDHAVSGHCQISEKYNSRIWRILNCEDYFCFMLKGEVEHSPSNANGFLRCIKNNLNILHTKL